MSSKKIKISNKRLLELNKKHDSMFTEKDTLYKSNKVYTSIYEGRIDGSVGTAWTNNFQGPINKLES